MIIDRFSFAPRYFSADFRRRIERDLFQARMGYSSNEYISLCFGVSVILAVFSLALFSVSLDYAPASVLVFAASFFSMTKYPEYRKRKRAREIEKHLPNCLRMIGIELNMGLPFETVLGGARDDSENGKEFSEIARSIDNGLSVQEAFHSFSERVDSNFVKRACGQIIDAYEKGSSGDALKKLAEEQESILRARIKEYNGKMVVYSLLFIAASAVFPAIFQGFVIVGSSFLDIGITALQAFLIPVLLFPVLNLLLFIIVVVGSP